jgi:hypothetical protein
LKTLAETGSKLDSAFGYANWGQLSGEEDGIDTSLRLLKRALVVEPDNMVAEAFLADAEAIQSLPEQSIRDHQKGLSLLSANTLGMLTATAVTSNRLFRQASLDRQLGNYHDAAVGDAEYLRLGGTQAPMASAQLAVMDADEHDLAAARATLTEMGLYRSDFEPGHTALWSLMARLKIDSKEQNWAGVLSESDAFAPMLQKYPGLRSLLPTMTAPLRKARNSPIPWNCGAKP